MAIALITGSTGLIGSEAAAFFNEKGFDVIGIDNDMRSYFFGPNASTKTNANLLSTKLKRYTHFNYDIRDVELMKDLFSKYSTNIKVIIHCAAQPSHDWAAKEPFTDFSINANGTLNLLELTRTYAPDAAFIFTSTNKVYGDRPNYLPLVEKETRWELDESHPFAKNGIDESMSIDNSLHSIFGASKVAADIMVQEYGKYFGINSVAFRGGCLTGPAHRGAELHGFLAYLVSCGVTGKQYMINGYKGKQVRDNIHSKDLVNAFWSYFNAPRPGERYNIGGSRFSNVSIIEAVAIIENLTGKKLNYKYSNQSRKGDHIWYISDVGKFQKHYPGWKLTYNSEMIIREMVTHLKASS